MSICAIVFDKSNPKAVSRTQQQYAKESDVNTIIAKYRKNGVLPNVNSRVAMFGDFADLTDFQEIQNRLLAANEKFMTLPALVRDKFNNDVGELLKFVADKNNEEEAVKLGLLPVSIIETKDAAAKAAEAAAKAAADADKAKTAAGTPA